jgi:hypothetical protein
MNLTKEEAVMAYLAGNVVQFKAGEKWMLVNQYYLFDHYHVFRIKPAKEELVRQVRVDWAHTGQATPNLRLEWHPETYELIKAEIIK